MLNLILKDKILDRTKIPKLTNSDLGLWINHKARLFCPDNNEIDRISEQIEEIDQFLDQLIELCSSTNTTSLTAALSQFDEQLQTIARSLGSLAQHCLAMDSGKDTLTRLMNRRYLDTVLQKETLFSIKNIRPYVIMMIDIDHFKRINDEYGHDAGDKVLGQVAEILDSTVRAGDYIFRYGGEEFLILLPDIRGIYARNVAEKLRSTIEKYSFDIGRQQFHITISLGLAEHDGQPDFSRIVAQADSALYQAKDAGRNQYRIAGH